MMELFYYTYTWISNFTPLIFFRLESIKLIKSLTLLRYFLLNKPSKSLDILKKNHPLFIKPIKNINNKIY